MNFKTFISERNKSFWPVLFQNPFFIAMSLLFVIGKLATNLIMGASLFNSVRSGLMGFVLYIFACYIINLLSKPNINHDEKDDADAKKSLIKILVWFVLLLAALTLHVLNDYGVISFQIPLWGQMNISWKRFVMDLAERSIYIESTGLLGFPNLILYVIVPVVLLWRSGFKLPSVLGIKNSIAALPFVALYLVAFVIIKGISVTSLLTLAFVLIWPAFGEEFFIRGIIQRLFTRVIQNPITAIVITSVLFSISHIPIYFFGYSYSPIRLISSLLPIMLTSFFWGYGYHKTGVLWPWILIHALSDLVGF